METPLVSICCVTYNQASYIRQCLDGFMMQKVNFPIEVLIHDDASTDGTAAIIREYEAKYPSVIKPICQKENQYSKGVKITFTYNFPRVKGKYIAMCEGDDYWTDPYKLQKQVDFLESHPDYSLCFHNAKHHFENSDLEDSLFIKDLRENRDFTGAEIIQTWTIPTASVVLRKEIISSNIYKKIKSDKRIVFGDTPLFLTASRYGKMYGIHDCMSVYRAHEGGISTNFNYNICRKLPNHYKALLKIFGHESYYLRDLLSASYVKLAVKSFSRHEYMLSCSSFMQAVYFSPKMLVKIFFEWLNNK